MKVLVRVAVVGKNSTIKRQIQITIPVEYFFRRREPTPLRRRRLDHQNNLKFGQKRHFYATILVRQRQNGLR